MVVWRSYIAIVVKNSRRIWGSRQVLQSQSSTGTIKSTEKEKGGNKSGEKKKVDKKKAEEAMSQRFARSLSSPLNLPRV